MSNTDTNYIRLETIDEYDEFKGYMYNNYNKLEVNFYPNPKKFPIVIELQFLFGDIVRKGYIIEKDTYEPKTFWSEDYSLWVYESMPLEAFINPEKYPEYFI